MDEIDLPQTAYNFMIVIRNFRVINYTRNTFQIESNTIRTVSHLWLLNKKIFKWEKDKHEYADSKRYT